MEINETWYGRDVIKMVGLIHFEKKFNSPQKAFYNITIVIGDKTIGECLLFDTKEQAEQSRKYLIEQLNK